MISTLLGRDFLLWPPGLRVAAQEENSIVQAVEDASKPMFLAVRFHPEYMIYARRYRRLFVELIRLARSSAVYSKGYAVSSSTPANAATNK